MRITFAFHLLGQLGVYFLQMNVFATEKYFVFIKTKLYFYSEERYVQEKHMQ